MARDGSQERTSMAAMTEDEARLLVCPFLPCGREPMRSAIKMGGGPVSIGLSPTKCITSLCAMWEWRDGIKERGDCGLKQNRRQD